MADEEWRILTMEQIKIETKLSLIKFRKIISIKFIYLNKSTEQKY